LLVTRTLNAGVSMFIKRNRHGLVLGRHWAMADENPTNNSGASSSAGTQNTDGSASTPQTVPYDRFSQVIKERNELNERLQKLEQAQAKRDEEERLKRGEHEAVINELKPKASRAETLEKTLTEYLTAELESVPEDMRFLFADGDVAERLSKVKAAKAKGIIGKPTPPQTDAGATGRGVSSSSLTPEQQAMAKAAGMTHEQYAKALEKIQK